ncbi:MAG TPA: single-stranded DNA-binding protein [Kiritimatiellia bacterium]|nr:single-stranded DNA-binding protein [Kiritimatiellia bacterium]HRZ11241.1 single-stranded DNA-binding protein [Kiritimatiellia bacterium]HSA19092.1 single-stranded DNA-binding protein [Kiritimatiellia bacterium]
MVAMNKVLLMGNLTRDPEIRKTPGGASVLDLGLAINERYKGKDGKVVENVCFTDVVVWGRQAESCARYLTKGAPVLVEGSLRFDQWKTEDGQNRSRLKVHAFHVQFLGGKEPGVEDPSDEAAEQEPARVERKPTERVAVPRAAVR